MARTMGDAKRDWFVAVGDTSGEFAGGPLTFEAATVYGPFTAAQAVELSELSDEFPAGSYEVRIFKCQAHSGFARVRRVIQGLVAAAKREGTEVDDS